MQEHGADRQDCQYPGMEAYPNSGVSLGLYRLSQSPHNTDSVTRIDEIYSNTQCTDQDTALKRLESAKAHASAFGIAIESEPTPIRLVDGGYSEIKVTTRGNTLVYQNGKVFSAPTNEHNMTGGLAFSRFGDAYRVEPRGVLVTYFMVGSDGEVARLSSLLRL